jgi:hypothetical protein
MPGLTGGRLEEALGRLLDARAPGASVCPSEAARDVDPDGWRALMPASRAAAARMVARGAAEVTQGGRVVDPAAARGPIRVRRPPGAPPPR